MLGYFKAIDKNGNEIGRYKYSAVTLQQKKFLRANKDIRLFCCCNNENIEMKISSDLRIYPANQNVGEQHHEFCPKHIAAEKIALWSRVDTETVYYNVAAPYAKASDYAIKANSLTYQRLTSPIIRLPDNYLDFNKRLHQTLKYIKTPSDKILFDISVAGKNYSDFKTGEEYFVYGVLVGKPIVKKYGTNSILFLDIKDCFGFTRRFYANKEIFKEETSRLYDGSVAYVVSGFAYKKTNQSKILTLSDYCIKSISALGLFE